MLMCGLECAVKVAGMADLIIYMVRMVLVQATFFRSSFKLLKLMTCVPWPQLSIGEMTHSRKQGRGIMDRSFKPIRMCFRRDCSYERMLKKSKAQLYSTQCQGASYYMADTSGTRVCIDGFIIVDKADGSEQQVPWTVETYIKMSNMKYPSKARFYCVEELPGKTDV